MHNKVCAVKLASVHFHLNHIFHTFLHTFILILSIQNIWFFHIVCLGFGKKILNTTNTCEYLQNALFKVYLYVTITTPTKLKDLIMHITNLLFTYIGVRDTWYRITWLYKPLIYALLVALFTLMASDLLVCYISF